MLRVSLLDVNQSYSLHNSVLTSVSITFQFFFSKKYIGIISEKIEFKFSRALVDILNI